MSLFCASKAIAAKDLKLILTKGGIAQAMLLGLLIIFVFSLALEPGELVSARTAATMFWLGSAFTMVLVFNLLYQLEENNAARVGLLLLPCPVQAIWLAKAATGFLIIALAQLVFFPACVVFLGQSLTASLGPAMLGLLAADLGLAACGSLLGALSVGQSGRESLLSIVIFPILAPLLMAGIDLLTPAFGGASGSTTAWLGLALAFDGVFIGLGLSLYPFVYTGDV